MLHLSTSVFFASLLAAFPSSTSTSTPVLGSREAATRPACELAARAMLQHAHRTADAESWRSIARCAQDPDCDLARGWLAADASRRAARELGSAQFEARLAACALLQEDVYAPAIEPAQFTADVDNPWVSLVPGRTLVYAKRTAEGLERVEVTTLSRTVEIAGVTCRTVQTSQRTDGVLAEETQEWFAQHADGSVWCFGESVRRYADGFLAGIEGSWRAGVDDARPGVLVPAQPTNVGAFRRALSIGCVEDVRRVVATGTSVSVPFGQFSGAIEIEEFDPLEPLELLVEILVPGLGFVAEVDLRTGERLELVEIVEAPR